MIKPFSTACLPQSRAKSAGAIARGHKKGLCLLFDLQNSIAEIICFPTGIPIDILTGVLIVDILNGILMGKISSLEKKQRASEFLKYSNLNFRSKSR